MARAAGTDAEQPGAPTFDPDAVLPILIHGDAAFPGPGRRRRDAEPAPAARLHDRRHDPHHREQPDRLHDRRRTSRTARCYASGLARGFKIPIVHVNADDPEACIEAARLALRVPRDVQARLPDRSRRLPPLRPQRRRRAGVHAAGDVPARSPRIRPCARSGRRRSSRAGDRRPARADALLEAQLDAAAARRSTTLEPEQDFVEPLPEIAAAGHGGAGADRRAARAAARRSTTRCSPRPTDFTVHRKLERGREKRAAGVRRSRDERTIDWAAAEELALASILDDGIADPADRRGRRARHVQPSPRGASRRERPAGSSCRCRRCRRRARRSRSTTARSARTPPSASSTATTSRRPSGS